MIPLKDYLCFFSVLVLAINAMAFEEDVWFYAGWASTNYKVLFIPQTDIIRAHAHTYTYIHINERGCISINVCMLRGDLSSLLMFFANLFFLIRYIDNYIKLCNYFANMQT